MCLIEICKLLQLKNFENPYLNNFYILNKINSKSILYYTEIIEPTQPHLGLM